MFPLTPDLAMVTNKVTKNSFKPTLGGRGTMNEMAETMDDHFTLAEARQLVPTIGTVAATQNEEPPNEAPVMVESRGGNPTSLLSCNAAIWRGDTETFLKKLPREPTFDLIVTSPPYNIGKVYEAKSALSDYMAWQERIINELIPRLKDDGSLCWQVGNFVDNGQITPLDIEFAPIFKKHGLQLRNRIVWTFGHGLHTKRRFSGRYEVIMWYTKSDGYFFDVDPVRVPSKYPSKRHFKGPKKGELSGNPLGKNPEDVWSIPNVKSNHVEKTDHPCQFPVGLIERLVLSMSRPGGLVFDPFAGVSSAGVASVIHGRRFIGCELDKSYAKIGLNRLVEASEGRAKYRPHDKPVYDHTQSRLSDLPDRDGEE